jgi:3-oxoacyl-[acyl-carrier protein] reductase
MPERALEGKVAIVTGSSRGIGRAIALRLGHDGARVVVTYLGNRERAEEVVEAIRADRADAVAVRTDVRDLEQVRALFGEAEARFGGLDILVNNAAGVNVFKPTAQMDEAEYDSMFLVTRGVYFALQEAARRIRDGGRIVSISTAGTAQPMAGAGAYAGSKAAIEQFSNCLAKELGARGVTANTLAPGLTDTDGMVLGPEQVQGLIAQTPLGRLGRPEDVADAVALLVSPDAHWVTMQNVRATGGIV